MGRCLRGVNMRVSGEFPTMLFLLVETVLLFSRRGLPVGRDMTRAAAWLSPRDRYTGYPVTLVGSAILEAPARPRQDVPFALISAPLRVMFAIVLVLRTENPDLSLSEARVQTAGSSIYCTGETTLGTSTQRTGRVFTATL